MYTVESLKPILIPIAQRYGIKRMSVFGSVARGEATEKSDVDLLVDIPKGWTMLSLGVLYEEIENVLTCPFDLVTTGIEDQEFLNIIRKEEVVLYEQ